MMLFMVNTFSEELEVQEDKLEVKFVASLAKMLLVSITAHEK